VLFGRDAELEQIGRLLDAAHERKSSSLLVLGEPGAGKTALLGELSARARGMQVLEARGVESEAELAFAGLQQLLQPVIEKVDAIPSLQARALRGALALEDKVAEDRFAVSLAVLSLLAEEAETAPVLCVIDDAHWLDAPSLASLLFVARRLDAEGVVMLFAAREDEAGALRRARLETLTLAGLDADAARAMVSSRASGGIGPAALEALVQHAAGNALALVELPASLSPRQLAGSDPIPEPLPLTPDVERLFLERVDRLPRHAETFLLVAAADHTGRLADVIHAAKSLGADAEALATAERAGLVSVADGGLELRHPLLRSALYGRATSADRRAAHLALADAAAQRGADDEYAWHRAAAAWGPDEAVAAELEASAERARSRGGHAAAATALERAADLSPAEEAQGYRLVAAASSAWHAGQAARARALVHRARPLAHKDALIAELDHLEGDIEHRAGSLPDAQRILLGGASRASRTDPRRALDMLFDAASCAMQSGDMSAVVEAGDRASSLPRSGDEQHVFLADLVIAVGTLWLGATTEKADLMRDVLARASELDEPRLLAGAAMGAGTLGDRALEMELLARAVASARRSAAVDELTLALLASAVSGLLNGRFDVVGQASEGLDLAREAGLAGVANLHLAILAWFDAVRGAEAECLGRVAEIAAGPATSNRLTSSITDWAVGLLALGANRLDEAVPRLSAAVGGGHPIVALTAVADLVEALVRAGRREEAGAAAAQLAEFASGDGPPWARGLAARSRALVSDEGEAESQLELAIGLHETAGRPFDRARSELLLGEHLRRARQRVEARGHLHAAIDTLDSVGATPWAERARAELRASGATARRRDPSTTGHLTPQEQQVARLVADGLSNRDVAAQLFLSPRTIDAHLRRIFVKLDINSRVQLASRLESQGARAHSGHGVE
jgi:DNA-binding CsgD family transcriptional regulator